MAPGRLCYNFEKGTDGWWTFAHGATLKLSGDATTGADGSVGVPVGRLSVAARLRQLHGTWRPAQVGDGRADSWPPYAKGTLTVSFKSDVPGNGLGSSCAIGQEDSGRRRSIAARSARRWRACTRRGPTSRSFVSPTRSASRAGRRWSPRPPARRRGRARPRARDDRRLTKLQAIWPSGLPGGVIHADLFTDIVFFLGDRSTGLIDFYFACNDSFAYDLGVCLNAWCFEPDGAFNVSKGMAMIRGYESAGR